MDVAAERSKLVPRAPAGQAHRQAAVPGRNRAKWKTRCAGV